jgi:hypothetical protein
MANAARRARSVPQVGLISMLLSMVLLTSPAYSQLTERAVLGLGYEFDLSGSREEFLLPAPIVDPSIEPDHPLYLRIRAPWSLLEPRPGEYDWSEVDRIVDPFREANHVVALCLYGPNTAIDRSERLPSPDDPEVLKGWLEFVRAAARHFRGRVKYYEIWEAPNLVEPWQGDGIAHYAFLLKNTSVTIRSVDPESLIAQGGLAIDRSGIDATLAWQESLYRQEVATYVDVLPIQPSADGPFQEALSRTFDLLLAHDPSAQLWANGIGLEGATSRQRAADLLRRFIVGHGEGATLVTFDLEADLGGQPQFPGVLLDVHKLFIPTYSPVYGSPVRFVPGAGEGQDDLEGVIAYRFFDADTFQGLVGYVAADPAPDRSARMVLDTAAVRGVAVYDIIGGAAGAIRDIEPDFKTNTTQVPVVVLKRPQVLQYARVPIEGFEVEKEEVEIRDTGLITAEEVIAEHQRFMVDQDDRLANYRAEARVTYHYKISGSNTIDVTTDNTFYWDEVTGAEWEEKALYFNGVKWKSEKLPNLPLIQPEKVVILPLDINLDKDYTYEYSGREKVDGYDCHVLDFDPIDPSRSLYRGRVWIESRTFARVKMAIVQDNLGPPVISNDEKDHYRPIAGPDGTTYWLLTRIDGQQIYSTVGRNLVVLREIELFDFRINDPAFEEVRNRAYDSERRILRDTEKGFRYLEKDKTGARVVKDDTTNSTLFWLAGIFKQPGFDHIVPLAGVDYFTYGFRDGDLQMNAFLAGAFNTFTLTNPEVLDSRMDATVEVLTLLPNVTDRYLLLGNERSESNVDTRTQSLSGSLGHPLGSFFRMKATYEVEYVNYSRDEDTDSFVIPTDTLVHSGRVEGEFNRAGWTATASARRSHRASWDPWGDLPPASPEILAAFPGSACDSPGSCLADFDPDQDTYDRYLIAVAKQFFLPFFQKLRFETIWQTGSRLDRFSEFQFSYFGNRVRGLSGSGVRFDRGGIARAQYAFNIADVLRFSASLDHARVKNSLISDEYQNFTGFGLSGTLMGPWRTLIQFDLGVAVQSDIDELKGENEILIGFLKLF